MTSRMPDEIETLLEQARTGDASAIHRLIELHQPDIRRFAFQMCRTPEDAEDAIQHALHVVLTRIGGFRKAAKFTSWLFAIVRNECLSLLRRFSAQPYRDEAKIDSRASPDEALDDKHLAATVASAIAGLEPEQRQVFVMREIERLSAVEVAVSLKLSVPAVKSRLHRARERLRAELVPLARQFDIKLS